MEITAQDIRRVEFRERLRGYNQSDVDEFLEQVAAAVDRLHEQLRQATQGGGTAIDDARVHDTSAEDTQVHGIGVLEATEQAEVSPDPPAEAPAPSPAALRATDDSLRRTLELAQRAADMAVDEARQRAGAIVAEAEAMAVAVLQDAEERDRMLAEQAQADIRADVERLESARRDLRAEVEALTRLVHDERSRARTWLNDVTAALEGLTAQRDPGLADAGPGAGHDVAD